MKLYKILLYELLLIFASVLIFRGLWELFDKYKFMNNEMTLIISLIVGVVIIIVSLIKLNQLLENKNDRK